MMTELEVRDAKILYLADMGWPYDRIATEFGVAFGTVKAVVAKARKEAAEKLMSGHMQMAGRPRLRKVDGRWMCAGAGTYGRGKTATAAYNRWKRSCDTMAQKAAARAEKRLRKDAERAAREREKAAAAERIALPRAPRPHVPLVIPVFVQRQHARAAAVQPPLRSMASTPLAERID